MGLEYNARIVARELINPGLVVLRIKAQGELFSFVPGQYATLGLRFREPRVPEADPDVKPRSPDFLIRRAYSIASGSVQRQYVEFLINIVTNGELTPRLFGLDVGSELFMAPRAKGLFTLDQVPEHKHVTLIATGTGLAPYMSFLRTHLVPNQPRRYVILHGARYSWDLGYRAELETLARVCPNFTYIPSITRSTADPYFEGEIGRIQALLDRNVIEQYSGVPLDPAIVDVFLCGNPDMIMETSAALQYKGFTEDRPGGPKGTIHWERYW